MVDEIAASESWANFNIYLATEMVKEVAGRITSVSEGALPETIDDGTHVMIQCPHRETCRAYRTCQV